jgi:hypothetical protein
MTTGSMSTDADIFGVQIHAMERGPPPAAGLPCGSCGTELPPTSKLWNECATFDSTRHVSSS